MFPINVQTYQAILNVVSRLMATTTLSLNRQNLTIPAMHGIRQAQPLSKRPILLFVFSGIAVGPNIVQIMRRTPIFLHGMIH